MLSKNRLKYLHSLQQKKARRQEGVFVAEGTKCVGDLLKAGFHAKIVVCTKEWAEMNGIKTSSDDGNFHCKDTDYSIVTEEELRKASFLLHPQQVMAVFLLPVNTIVPSSDDLKNNLFIALDGVQDPGNLGTIIRIADWFGINTILCSNDTVDAFSPKVVQATMGSIARVNIKYCDLVEYIGSLSQDTPVYGTFLDGDNIYSSPLSENGIIVMGNEGNGISSELRKHINKHLLIPSYPPNSPTAESLNVAVATAITIAEFRRGKLM